MRIKEIITEADNPNFFGSGQGLGSASPIPGTPSDLMPKPSPKKIRREKKKQREMEKWVNNSKYL